MSKNCIIILHGWKLSGSRYNESVSILRKAGYETVAPDMPGFGREPLKSVNMDLDDYVLFLERFIKEEKISNPILIGHSFGGRVAIKYCYKHPAQVSKLILTGVPIIRHINLRQKISYVLAKTGSILSLLLPKGFFNRLRKMLYHFAGSFDYYKAGPMSNIFINIISEDLTLFVKKIKIPTFLLWGGNDRLTPVTDITEIKKYMPHAVLIVFPGGSHKLPYEDPRQFSKAVLNLIQ